MTTKTRRSLLLLVPLGLAAWAAGDALAGGPLHRALAGDEAPSQRLIEALRRQGPAAVAALLTDAPPEGSPQRERWERTLDAVCAQRDCAASGLYWYTDLEAAKQASAESGKPILSLRMLGDLREEFRAPTAASSARRCIPMKPSPGNCETSSFCTGRRTPGAENHDRLRRRPRCRADGDRQQRPLRARLAGAPGGRAARALQAGAVPGSAGCRRRRGQGLARSPTPTSGGPRRVRRRVSGRHDRAAGQRDRANSDAPARPVTAGEPPTASEAATRATTSRRSRSRSSPRCRW